LGIGDWGLGPIPNPQSPIPIPNPQSPIPNYIIFFIHKQINNSFQNLIYLLKENENKYENELIKK
jgi:hypothetical protein